MESLSIYEYGVIMQVGQLKHRITIQQEKNGTQNPTTGKVTTAWVDLMTIWADVSDLSTKDQLQAKALSSTIQARAKIRYSKQASEINTTMRVKFEGNYYQIDGNPTHDLNSRREYLTLNLSTGKKEWR